jgi:methanogenic corrinoid protein MtbC1
MLNIGAEITSNLEKITLKAAEEYNKKMNTLIKEVNENLSQRDDLMQLIGNNPIKKMKDNHENHAGFMYNSFKVKSEELFINTIIWVYRTYKNHGFSYQYFPVELKAWKSAVNNNLSSENSELIINIYNLMLDNHKLFVKESESREDNEFEVSFNQFNSHDEFLKALLEGNHDQCLSEAENIKSKDEMLLYFENMIKPTMYKVGSLWEKGVISTAQEHLASSIVARVNSSIYANNISLKKNKGKAVISAAMPFNIVPLKETISKIRDEEELKNIKILVGGKIFNENLKLWEKVGADACAFDSKEALRQANKWWEEVDGKNV